MLVIISPSCLPEVGYFKDYFPSIKLDVIFEIKVGVEKLKMNCAIFLVLLITIILRTAAVKYANCWRK